MDHQDWELRLLAEVRPLLEGEHSGHDLGHMLRVRRLALHIAEREGGDADVLSAAALLHDLFRDHPANADKSVAVDFAREALSRCGFPAAKVESVVSCITGHSWSQRHSYAGLEVPPEVLIFRDADRLDALGAWGIGRTFAYGGAHTRPMGGDLQPADQLLPTAASSDQSTVAHFHDKLLHLAGQMNTATGQALARRRHQFLVQYLQELEHEATGEPEW